MICSNAGIVESKGGREGGYFVDCGEAGEQLDVELEKILHEAELKTIEYLRNYTIAQLMNRVQFFKEQ